MSNDKLRNMMVISSKAIAEQMLTPKDCFRKALIKLKESKQFNDQFFKNNHINQAIKYLELGIEKC